MVGRRDELAINHELVGAASKELTEFANALTAMRAYAHADDGMTADKFGPIAGRTGVGQTYTQLRESLRNALDKAVPTVDGLAQALASAQTKTAQADADIAARIAKVDDGGR